MVGGIRKSLLFICFILFIFEPNTFYLNSVWRENVALNDYIAHFGKNYIRKFDWSWIARKFKVCYVRSLKCKLCFVYRKILAVWWSQKIRPPVQKQTKEKTVEQYCRYDDGWRPARLSRTSTSARLKSTDCLFCWTSSNVCQTTSPPCCICKLNK